jgi:large subunit ribosomal protein L7/L12
VGLFGKPQVISPASDADRARIAELEQRVALADTSRIAELEQRVARLEAQLAQLTATPVGSVAAAAAAAAVTPAGAAPEPWMAEVQALRSAGKTIHAIKVYRDHTGVGLKQAKEAVEALPI